MTSPICIVSSMATRQVLAELVGAYRARTSHEVLLESVGGVDAARRVRAGEPFDAVVLAADVIDQLVNEGRLLSRSRVDLVRSGVALAVRHGAPRPDIGSEDAVRRAVLAARTVSYSTGPSGVHIAKLFKRWGIADPHPGPLPHAGEGEERPMPEHDAVRPRIVQAPPGVPVGTLVAEGKVELGFQQFAELMHLKGIEVLGPLPPAIQIVTTFSGGVAATSVHPEEVRTMLAFMASPAADAAKRRNGMEPA